MEGDLVLSLNQDIGIPYPTLRFLLEEIAFLRSREVRKVGSFSFTLLSQKISMDPSQAKTAHGRMLFGSDSATPWNKFGALLTGISWSDLHFTLAMDRVHRWGRMNGKRSKLARETNTQQLSGQAVAVPSMGLRFEKPFRYWLGQ